MRRLVRTTLQLLFPTLLSGCLTAHYAVTSTDAEVRMSGRREGEQQIRHVDVFLKKSHFLFGTIPNKPNIDVAKAVGLQPGEALVNLKIDEGYPDGHLPFLYGLAGFLFPVWNPHAVMISGDIVKLADGKAAPAAAPASVPLHGAPMAGTGVPVPVPVPGAPSAPAPSPADAPTPGRWQHLHGTYSQEDAERGCVSVGAELPTRAQLKAGKEILLRNAGDLWTSEREGDDGWTFNAASGATFLKSSGDAFGAYCREKGS